MYSPKAYIEELLLSKLDDYIYDFNRQSLDIGLWKGEVALKNFKLKRNIWQVNPDLNLTLEHGHVDNLHIDIPWTKLHTGQFTSYVKNVYLVFKLNVNETTEKELNLKEEAYIKKMKAVDKEELDSLQGNRLEPEKWGSKYYHNLVQSLLSRITSGFEFHGTNFRISLILPSLNINETIHVRLLVSSIHIMQAQPDQFSRSSTVPGTSNDQAKKVIDIQDLAISVSSIPKPYNTVAQSESDIFNLISDPLKDIFLNPCHLSVQLYGPRGDDALYSNKRVVSVQLSNTEITPSYQQLFLLCNSIQRLQIDVRKSMLHHIRSTFIQEKVNNKSNEHKKASKKRVLNYKHYWVYCIEAIKYLNRQKLKSEGIGGMIESCKNRVMYKVLYRKHISHQLSLQDAAGERGHAAETLEQDRCDDKRKELQQGFSKKDILIIRKSVLRSIAKKGVPIQRLRQALAPKDNLELIQQKREAYDEIDNELSTLLESDSAKDLNKPTAIEWDVDVCLSRFAISIFDASFTTKLSNTFQLLPAPRLSIAVYAFHGQFKVTEMSKSIFLKFGAFKVFGTDSLELLSCGKEPDFWLGDEAIQHVDDSDFCFNVDAMFQTTLCGEDGVSTSSEIKKRVDVKMRLEEMGVQWDEHSLHFARDLFDGLFRRQFLVYNDPFLQTKRLVKRVQANKIGSRSLGLDADIVFKGFKLKIPYRSSVEANADDHSYKIVKSATASQYICVVGGAVSIKAGRFLPPPPSSLNSKASDIRKSKEPASNAISGRDGDRDMYAVYIDGKTPKREKTRHDKNIGEEDYYSNEPLLKWEKIDEKAYDEVKCSNPSLFNTVVIHVEDSNILFTKYSIESDSLLESKILRKPFYFCAVVNISNAPLCNTSTNMTLDLFLSPLVVGLTVNGIMALLDAANSITDVIGVDAKHKNAKVMSCLPPRVKLLSSFCTLQMTCHADDIKVSYLNETKSSVKDSIQSSIRQFLRLRISRSDNSRLVDIYKHVLLLKLRNFSQLSLLRLDEILTELTRSLSNPGCNSESELLSTVQKICSVGPLADCSTMIEPILSLEVKGFELSTCAFTYDKIVNVNLKELLVSDRYGDPIFEIASKVKELENNEEGNGSRGNQKKSRSKSSDKVGSSTLFYSKLAEGFKGNRPSSLSNECALSMSFLHQDVQYDWGQGGHSDNLDDIYCALYKYEILNCKTDDGSIDPYFSLHKNSSRDLEGRLKFALHELYCFIPSSAIPYMVGELSALHKHIKSYLVSSSIVTGRKIHYDWKDLIQAPVKGAMTQLPHNYKKPQLQHQQVPHASKNANGSNRKPYLTSLAVKLASAVVTLDYNEFPLSHCRISQLSLDLHTDQKSSLKSATALVKNIDLYDLTEAGRFHSQIIWNKDQGENLVECNVVSKADEVTINTTVTGLNLCYVNRFKLELESFFRNMKEGIIASSRSEVTVEIVGSLIESDYESIEEDVNETDKASAVVDSDDSNDSSDSSSDSSEENDIRILSSAKKGAVSQKKSGAYMPMFRHSRPLKAAMTPSKLQSTKKRAHEPNHLFQDIDVAKVVRNILNISFQDLTVIVPRNSNSMELVALVVDSASFNKFNCSESWMSPMASTIRGKPIVVQCQDEGGEENKGTLHFDSSSNEWRTTKHERSTTRHHNENIWELPVRKNASNDNDESINESSDSLGKEHVMGNYGASDSFIHGYPRDNILRLEVRRKAIVLNNVSIFVSLVNNFSANEYKATGNGDDEKYFSGVYEHGNVYFGNKNNSQSWTAATKTPFNMNIVVDHCDGQCRVLIADTEDFSTLDLNLSMAQLYLLESIWFDNFFELPQMFGRTDESAGHVPITPITKNEFEVPSYGSPAYFDHFLGRIPHFELLLVRASVRLNTSMNLTYFQEDPKSLVFLQRFNENGLSRTQSFHGADVSANVQNDDVIPEMEKTLPICLISMKGLVYHSRGDGGETNRIAAAASYIEIEDRRAPISTAYPIILCASCVASMNDDERAIKYFEPDFDYGLHMKPDAVTKSTNIPIQFSYLKSQLANWGTSNIGLDNLDLRIENADMLWILIDYFSCYNKSPAFGNPAVAVYQSLPPERKPYSGTDVRLFVTKPHVAIMQNPMNIKSPSLFLETEKGVFYRFLTDSESSTKMELNIFEVALVIMKSFRPPPEARRMRGSAGSGRGIRTIVEFLSLAYSLENHLRSSTVDMLLNIFYANSSDYEAKESDSFVQLEHSHYRYQIKDWSTDGYKDLSTDEFVADIAQPKCIFPLTNADSKFDSTYNIVTSYEDLMFIVTVIKQFLKMEAANEHDTAAEELHQRPKDDPHLKSNSIVKKFSVVKVASMKLVIVDNILGLHLPLAQIFVDNVDLNVSQKIAAVDQSGAEGNQRANSEIGAYLHIVFWSDYFNNLKKCWEPFMEKFDARCFYEENPSRGKGITLRVLSDAHFTVTGALLRSLDDGINMVKTYALNKASEDSRRSVVDYGSQLKLNVIETDSRELKPMDSTQALRRFAKKENSDTRSSSKDQAEHVQTAHLPDAVRVGFSILNLTGQPVRYFQQWEDSTKTVEYINDNTRGLLNCVASTKKIRNNDIIEEAFNIQTEYGDTKSRKYQVVGHKVAVQLSGYEWISSVQADEPGVKFQPLVPIKGRIGLDEIIESRKKEFDGSFRRKIRNALQLVTEVVPHNGGRLLKLRSVFTIKNNTSHAIKILSVDCKENYSKMPDEPFILNGADSLSLPIALLHKSVLNSNGLSMGCLFICPEDNTVIEKEYGRRASHNQSIDYSREPVNLLDIIIKKNFESGNDDFVFSKGSDQSSEKNVSIMMQLFCNIGTRRYSVAENGDADHIHRKNPTIHSSKLPYFCYNVEIQRHGSSVDYDSKQKDSKEAYLPTLGMYKDKILGSGAGAMDVSPVHYTIVIHPPIILENLLPSGGIFELMHATQKVILWSAYIEAGEAKPIHTVTLDAPLMLLLNLRYCKTLDGTLVHKPRNNNASSGIAGKIQKTLEGLLDESDEFQQNDEEHLILTDTAGQKIRLNIENSEGGGGQRHISIFCPYWIVNTTQYALQIQEDGSNSLPAGTYNVGLNKDGTRSVDGLIDNLKTRTNDSTQKTVFPGKPGPLKFNTPEELGVLKNLSFEQTVDLAYMFNYDNAANLLKMVRRVSIRLDNSDWCYPFSLDSIGVNQSITIDDGYKGVLELGFHIQLAPGRLSKFTKIVRFMPKFVVVNNMQSNLKILQPTVFGQSKVELDLNANCWKPYHLPDSEGFRALIVRMEAPWGQCIPFTIDAMGKYTLSIKKVTDLTSISHVDTRGSQDFTVEINSGEEKISEIGLWFETDWNEANVVVKSLRKGSFAAEKLNVQVGDVLLMIDGDPITGGKMFEQAMSLIKDKVRSGKAFTLKFLTIEEKIRQSLLANNRMSEVRSINSSNNYGRMNDIGKVEIPIHLELKTVEASTFITISSVDETIKAEYRLENKTASHYIYYKQKGVIGNMWCELGPGEAINYICEDPFIPRKLFLKAGRNVLYPDSEVSPDKYFKLRIQSLGSDLIKDNIGFLTGGTIDSNVTIISLDAIGQREVILLRDSDCKLRTIVEAEGPTKILRIYPDANIGDLEKKETEKLFESDSFKKELMMREFSFSIVFMKEQVRLLKEWKGIVDLLIKTNKKGEKEVQTNEKQVPSMLSGYNEIALDSLKKMNEQCLAASKKDIDHQSTKVAFGNKLSASLATDKIENLVGHTFKDVGHLFIQVLEAKELRPFVTGKKENIFVKLYIKSENQRFNFQKFNLFGKSNSKYTYVCGQTLDPTWLGQKFIIKTPEVSQPKAFKLRVVVQSHGIVRSQRFLGRADIQFSYLHHQEEVEGWFPLRARESIRASALNADTGNMTGSVGSIKLRVQWVHNAEGLAHHYNKRIEQRLEQLHYLISLQKKANKELLNTISRNVGPIPDDDFEMKNVMTISSVIPSPATIIQTLTKPAIAFTGYAIEQTKNVIGMKKIITDSDFLAGDEGSNRVVNYPYGVGSHDDFYDEHSPVRDADAQAFSAKKFHYPDTHKAVSFFEDDINTNDVNTAVPPSSTHPLPTKTRHTLNLNNWINLNEQLRKADVDKFMKRYPKIVDADNYFQKRLEEECSRSYKHIHSRNGTLEIIPVTAEDLPWDKSNPDRPLHIKIEYGEKVHRSSSAIRAANLTWYYEDTNITVVNATAEDGSKQTRSKDKSSIMEFDINTSLVESAIRVRVIEEFYTHNKELARVELPVLNLLDCICTLKEGDYYDMWFPLTLAVNSLHAEGEKQNFAQTVLTEQEHEKTFSDAHKPCIRLKIRWTEKDDKSGPLNCYNYLRVQLPSLSISIVDSATLSTMARDVLHISFTGSDIRHSRSYENTIWMINVNWFQIDNQIADSVAPVLLAPTVLQRSKPVFMMQSLKNNLLSTDKLNSYDYIALQIQELDVKIEQQTVVTLWDIWQSWVRDHRQALSEYLENNTGAKNLLHSSSELLGFATCKADALSNHMNSVAMFQHDEDDDYQHKLYIRTCVLKELKINISFIIGTTPLMLSSAKSLSTERFTIGQSLGLAYTLFAFLRQIGEVVIDLSSSISDAPIRISQYSEHHIFLTEHEFSKRLQSHYFQFLMQQVYKIVGSLDLVGNPVNLLSTLGTGVKDFFFEPALAMIDNPTEISKLNKLGKGFLKGAISLVSNTSTGFIGAGTTVTRAVGRNFAKLSMDKAFIRNREELQRAPKTIREAFVRPFRDVGNGLYCGFVGLVKAPYNTFRYNKISTLFTGIMIGVTGLATKPSVGVLDAVTHTGDAFQLLVKTLKHDYAEPVTRGRLSYVFGLDGRILEYDYATALGQKIIDVLNIVKDDQGIRYSIQDGSRLFMKFGTLCMCTSSDRATAIPLKISGPWKSTKTHKSQTFSRADSAVFKSVSPFDDRDYNPDRSGNEKDQEFVIHVTIIPKDIPGIDQVVILTTARVVVVDYQRKKGGTTIKLQFEIALHQLKVVDPVDKMLGTKCTLRLLFDDSNGLIPRPMKLPGLGRKDFFEKGLLQGDYELVADKTHEDALDNLRNNINIVANGHFVDEDADDEHGYIHKIGVWEFTTANSNAKDNDNSGFDNKAVRSALEMSKWHFGDFGTEGNTGRQLPKWLQEDITEAIEAHSDIKEINNILLTQTFDNPDFQDHFEHLKSQSITFKGYKEQLVELEKMTAFNETLRIETQRNSKAVEEYVYEIDDSAPSTAIGKIMTYTARGFDRVVTSTRNVGAAAASVISKKSPIQLTNKHTAVKVSNEDFAGESSSRSRANDDSDSSQDTPISPRDRSFQMSPMPFTSESSFQDMSQLSSAESISLMLSRLDRLENLMMTIAQATTAVNKTKQQEDDADYK